MGNYRSPKAFKKVLSGNKLLLTISSSHFMVTIVYIMLTTGHLRLYINHLKLTIGHHRVNLIFQYKVTPGGIQVTLES